MRVNRNLGQFHFFATMFRLEKVWTKAYTQRQPTDDSKQTTKPPYESAGPPALRSTLFAEKPTYANHYRALPARPATRPAGKAAQDRVP